MDSDRIEILVEIKGGSLVGVFAKTAVPVDVSVLDWDNVQSGDTFRDMDDPDEIEKWVENNFPEQID